MTLHPDVLDYLDEAVHERKSYEATDLNNEGPKAQLEYLGMSLREVEGIVFKNEEKNNEQENGR